MSDLNVVILSGNLGGKPEAVDLPSGTKKASFNLATNRVYNNGDGEMKKETSWHRIVCFGKLAERVIEHKDKGDRVEVQGNLNTRSYQKEGETRWVTEVKADRINFVYKAKNGENNAQKPEAESEKAPEEANSSDEVPF